MYFCKAAVVCVAVVAMGGCEQSQPESSVQSPESALAIGMDFKLIPVSTFLMGWSGDAQQITLTQPF